MNTNLKIYNTKDEFDNDKNKIYPSINYNKDNEDIIVLKEEKEIFENI